MREINIANNIVRLRKERNISQDVLASFLGVTKASVSKWETAQCYPDITLLPKIASYFDTTIDDLLEFHPQMSSSDICMLYEELTQQFHNQSFEEVYERCKKIIKKYYSCYPLLIQIAALLVKYCNLSKHRDDILLEARELLVHVKTQCQDVNRATLAQNLEATCLLMLQKPEEIIALYENAQDIVISNDTLKAMAYQMLNENQKSKYILQVSSYQYLLILCEQLSVYLSMCGQDKKQFHETYQRIISLIISFNLKQLHPTFLLKIFLEIAQVAMNLKEITLALECIQEYVAIATSDIYPIKLHGDSYFYLIDEWFAKINQPVPLDDEGVKESILYALDKNQNFIELQDNPTFQMLIQKLKTI